METKTMLENAGYKLVAFPAPDITKVRVAPVTRTIIQFIVSPVLLQVLYYFNGMVLADANANAYSNMTLDVTDSSLSGLVAAITAYKLPR